jgi:hypothetical protein
VKELFTYSIARRHLRVTISSISFTYNRATRSCQFSVCFSRKEPF